MGISREICQNQLGVGFSGEFTACMCPCKAHIKSTAWILDIHNWSCIRERIHA